MKDLLLLHWMLEDCRKKKGNHENCICTSGTMPKFNQSEICKPNKVNK